MSTSEYGKIFSHKGVRFFPFSEYGSYFGMWRFGPSRKLFSVAMLEDGSPDIIETEPNVVEVTSIEDDEEFLAHMNHFFVGSKFTMDDFPGR